MKRPEKVSTIVACDLAGEIVRSFGEVCLRVFGTSMVPAILPGDLISAQRADLSEISIGDVVLYAREGRMFAHRVMARSERAEWDFAAQGRPLLITRGDRLCYDDPPVSSTELLGRVISIQRSGFRMRPAAGLSAWQRTIIGLLRRSDYATYLYVRLVRGRRAIPLQFDATRELQQSAGRAECRV